MEVALPCFDRFVDRSIAHDAGGVDFRFADAKAIVGDVGVGFQGDTLREPLIGGVIIERDACEMVLKSVGFERSKNVETSLIFFGGEVEYTIG